MNGETDMPSDDHPEGNAYSSPWETRGAPPWQAAIIRLARPVLLWVLGVVVMGWGVVFVGAIEAIFPGVGIRMAAAMAALLRAYPDGLYYLIGAIFLGQAVSSVATSFRGRGR
jgi:hypothetical protein